MAIRHEQIVVLLNNRPIAPHLLRDRKLVRISDSLDRLDEMELRIWIRKDFPREDVDWIGKPFKVTIESGSDKRELEGDILEVSLQKRSDGAELLVRGIDKLHKAKVMKKTQIFEEMTHSDIAKALAGDVNLGDQVEATSETAANYVQANITPARFLKALAHENAYAVRVDAGKLRFMRPEPSGGDVSVSYYAIQDLKFTTSLDDVVTKVTVMGYDATKAEVVKGQATSVNPKISGGKSAAEIAQQYFGTLEWVVDNSNVVTSSQAKALAQAELQRRASRFVVGSLVCPLEAKAKSGGKLTITDSPWPFDGAFLIREVNHVYEGGQHSTQIEFTSNSLKS